MDQHTQSQVVSNIPMVTGEVMKYTQGGRLLPYIKDHVYCNYGKNYFTTFAEMWMDKAYESDTEIFHIEENMQVYTVKVKTDVQASAAGAQATLAYTQNTFGSMTNLQPGYFIAVPPIGKLAKIVSVNTTAKTFVVEPNDKNYRINLKGGQEVIIIPAAIVASCGCDEIPSSMKTPGMMYKSNMMIIKKNLKICGEDLAKWLENRTLFPLKSLEDPCKDIEVWWHADLENMWFEYTLAKQIFVMLGEDITNNTDNFTNLKCTTGVIPILRSRATQAPVASEDGITWDYFTRLTSKIKRTRNYCTQFTGWHGANHRSQIDMLFEKKVSKTDVSWNFLEGDKQRGIEFGFEAAKIDGIEFYFHDEASLNDPGFLGAEGFNGPDTSFWVPMCKVNCGGKNNTPIVINYLAGNGVNRELVEDDWGVLRPGTARNCDWHEWSLFSQFGIDVYCANNFIFTESI